MSESSLLDAARAGDRAALEALLAENQARIYRFSKAMCREPRDAEEVLQDTMLALARGVADIRGPSVSTWLYAVARSYCARRRRRGRFAPNPGQLASVDELPLVDPGERADLALDARRLDRALHEAIFALDPGLREVMVLRDVEGLSAAEVAETLGLSEAAVKSRLHRARRQVRDALAPMLSVDDPRAEGTPAAGAACPDILRQLSRDLEGEISPRTCARMERHLAGCPRCRQTCDSLKRTLALCRAVPTPEVPPELQRSVRVAIREFLLPS